ncbi:MAG TPA: inositol monophosphatase family protein [Nonomuraea sp.]|uniref:inositol monophosphatase family protein n=1 Tax=Nonomuraea sp. NPDC049649 TaxID=3155776 RepID=UPI002B83A753|nr:inositol monophosphatase family protein [Nonomuraea sp.]
MAETMTPEGFLRLAEDIAREAGDMLVAKRPAMSTRSADIETKSSPTDVVTVLDLASEQLIRERILAARPGDRILGEEEGDRPGETDVRWVVDPIDGTVNFLYGLPDWAVSIAVEVRGRIVAGVVNAAARGEVYTASEGGGAWLAGERLRCNPAAPLGQALVATGFGYDAALRAEQAEVLTGVLPRVRDIRRGGSCAVDLCSVASGRVDAYYERGVNYWDYAAGGLIAAEAGATLGVLDVEPGGERVTLCAAPGLFEELHGLLTPLHTESGS